MLCVYGNILFKRTTEVMLNKYTEIEKVVFVDFEVYFITSSIFSFIFSTESSLGHITYKGWLPEE